MGTRAKMSGANEFGTSNSYCRHIEGYAKATCALRDYVLEGDLSRLAEQEARAILAETENEQHGSYQPLSWLGDWSADVAPLFAAFVQS